MSVRSAKARFVFLNVAALLSIALLASVSWAQTQSQWAMTRSPIGLNNSVRLQSVQMVIGKYVGMTLELGRVPAGEDLALQDGCCGGGGCGC